LKGIDMTKVIIYPDDEGRIVVVHPAAECALSVEEIAKKDVPAGKPYHIIDKSQLPEDFVFFGAWEADFSNPDGHGVGHDVWYAEQN